MRLCRLCTAVALLPLVSLAALAAKPNISQRPALTKTLIAFRDAGNPLAVPRGCERATRLTMGVGIETASIFSPDGSTIALTADHHGNTDIFTISAPGGFPHRITSEPTHVQSPHPAHAIYHARKGAGLCRTARPQPKYA